LKGGARNVLLLDLDGTLVDSRPGVLDCFRFALAGVGRPQPAGADLTWIIGPPLRRSFAALLGGPADVEAALGLYRARYASEGLFQATVYDGVEEALAELKTSGVRLFLCTSKPLVYAERILERFDLARHFEAAFGAELEGRLEDKGELIAHILADRRLKASAFVMLGDRSHDVVAARRHAIPAIGALWGYGGEEELSAAGRRSWSRARPTSQPPSAAFLAAPSDAKRRPRCRPPHPEELGPDRGSWAPQEEGG